MSAHRKIAGTLYNSKDCRNARRFFWTHNDLVASAPSPANIGLAKDEAANQVQIIDWPGEQSQYATVSNPLLQEQSICEIETQCKADLG